MLHIILKGITNAATWWQIFCSQPNPPRTLGMGSIGQNSTFSEYSHVAYQIKENHKMQQHGSKYFARRHPTTLGDGVKRSKLNFFRTWSSCIVIKKRESRMQQHEHGSKYFDPPTPTHPDHGDGVNRVKILLFQNIACCL